MAKKKEEEKSKWLYDIEPESKIEKLELNTYTYNALKRAKIHRIKDLYKYHKAHYKHHDWALCQKDSGIWTIRGIGMGGMLELEEKLIKSGFPSLTEYDWELRRRRNEELAKEGK